MRGSSIKPDVLAKQTRAADMDAAIVAGGNHVAPLASDENILTLLLELDQEEKPIGAIGRAPAVLASAGILDGRRVACSSKIQTIVAESGAECLDGQCVVVHHNILTMDKGEHFEHFVDAIAFMAGAESVATP